MTELNQIQYFQNEIHKNYLSDILTCTFTHSYYSIDAEGKNLKLPWFNYEHDVKVPM